MILGLKEDLVECATVCVKGEVILVYYMDSYRGIKINNLKAFQFFLVDLFISLIFLFFLLLYKEAYIIFIHHIN